MDSTNSYQNVLRASAPSSSRGNTSLPSSSSCKRRLLEAFDGETENPRSIIQILDNIENFKPILKSSEMAIGKEYEVVAAKKVYTKYGERVVIELQDYQLFLPPKYAKLEQNIIQTLCSGNFCVKNLGRTEMSYKFQFVLKDE